MNNRTEATTVLINWIKKQHNYYKNNGNYTVKIIETDNGSEYLNKKFNEYCESKSI